MAIEHFESGPAEGVPNDIDVHYAVVRAEPMA